MKWVVNGIFFGLALVAVLQMFVFKYRVIAAERTLRGLYAQIRRDVEDIHVLEAEWALRNDPERLKVLVAQHTKLKDLSPKQIIHVQTLTEGETHEEK